ncbi:MAG: hypothetical protein ACP5J4_08410 [Anaerolineae bacterium]
MNYALRITYHVSRITFCALLLFLAGCGARYTDEAYIAVGSWLDTHALPSERVAVPETVAQRLTAHPLAALPKGADAEALLATLRTELPDYVVAWPGVAWDGVRAHPWFQEHYRFLDTLSVSGDGLILLRIYGYMPSPFDLGEWRPVEHPLDGTGLDLYAVRVNRQRLIPGEPLYVTLAWRGDLFALPDAHRLVLRLVDVAGDDLHAQVEHTLEGGLPVDLRRDGDDVTSRYVLAVPDNLPYGDYVLTFTLYRRSGALVGRENLPLTTLSRPPEVARVPPTPESEGAWSLGEAISLVGYDAPERVAPGDAFRVTLYWHARAAVPGDYTVFVHLLDAAGAAVTQADGKPVWWTYPTAQWEAGQYIRDAHILELDAGTARGDYTLAMGMYDAETGTRLEATDAQAGVPLPDGRIELRVVKVR